VEKFQANKITDVKVYDTIMELPSFALWQVTWTRCTAY
jgi:hypothetical protein